MVDVIDGSAFKPFDEMAKATPRTNTVKSFNVVSHQNLVCRVHPSVVFTILDAFVRRPESATRAIGTLLGYVAEGNILQVTDAFTVVHQDNDNFGVLMDQEYHRQMVKLRQKVAPKEQVVGWFCTGSEVVDSSVVIHNFYLKPSESGFQPSPILQSPIHMIVDTELVKKQLTIKAFLSKVTNVADTLVQFHEIPLKIEALASEKTGISMLLRAQESQGENGTISSMDAFRTALERMLELFQKCKTYTGNVLAGSVEGDATIGRELTSMLCSESFFNVEAFEDLIGNSMQDTLMTVYLSNLTRTQITLAEKINAAYSASTF
jgi:hypothetical protein